MNRIILLLLAIGLHTTDLAAQSAAAVPTTAFFQQLNIDRGYVLCPNSAGNLFLAGMRDVDMVLLEMTTEGAVLSARYIDVGVTGLDVLSDMLQDSDGHLVISGNLRDDLPDNGYVFRYDPVLRKTLWAKTFGPSQTMILGVLENGPGGNFFVYANPHIPGGDDAEFFQLDRNTGNMVPGSAWRYHLGTSENFHSIVLHDGALYAAGRFTDGFGSLAFANMRHALLKIDPTTGTPEWVRLSHISPPEPARLYGRDLVVENGAIISTFSGNDAGATLDVSCVFLQKNNLDGDVLWLKKIDLTEWPAEWAEEIVSVPDGFVLYGRALNGDALFLLKTDKDGNLQWARKVQPAVNNRIIGNAQNQLVAVGEFLFATGYSVNAATISNLFLLKTDACGMVGDNCAVVTMTPAICMDIPNPVSYEPITLVNASPTFALDLPVAPPVNFIPQKNVVCSQIVGLCQDLPDLTFTVDSIQCQGGGLTLFYTTCNQGGIPLTSNYQVRFYPDDPTQTATTELGSTLIFLNQPLGPGECRSGVLSGLNWPLDFTGPQAVYSVVNHNGLLPTPFSFASFPTTALEECDYENNLSIALFTPPNIPVLDLGPDVILCQPTTVEFDAGSGFVAYLWQDGSTGQTLTATDPGLYYWVEVTDACGGTQRDSVFFSFSLLPDTKFGDTTICPGESVTYSLPGFSTYEWAPAAGLDCTDCPTVTASPAATTTYTVFATDTLGCELRDTFTVAVRIIPVLDLGPDVILCQPTTVEFDAGSGFETYLWQDGSTGQTLTATDPGLYYWVEVTDACGGTQRDSVFFSFSLLPDTKFGDTTICPGESVTYTLPGFATYEWAPAAGLDCTDCPTVTASPAATTTYTLFAADTLGCELRDTFTVAVRIIPVLDLGPDVILCQPTTVEFDAGSGFETYLWQDGSTGQTLTATDPGLYYWVEVTDACGGTQRDSVFFSFSLLPDTKFGDTTICPGESVTYTLPGFATYEWAPAAGLNCTNCPTVTASPAATTTYTLFAADTLGCELRDTFTVTVYGPANLTIQCPANLTVATAPGGQTATATFANPTTATDCPCGDAAWALTQGLPSGANFPIGATQVCFTAEDGCFTTASCCFTVTVTATPPDPDPDPCDVKETPCVRFEILGITQNPKQQKTYRMRVINKCANELMYVTYQLPAGITAKAPATGSVYTAPSGRQYEVRNPNFAPTYSIRFKTIGTGIASGQSDIFEYTLPAQANPVHIHTSARLAPQIYAEAHLNVFACVVQQTSSRPDGEADAVAERSDINTPTGTATLRVYPNPVTNWLQVDLSSWQDVALRLVVTDALGRTLLDSPVWASGQVHPVEIPEYWPSGVYFLTVLGTAEELSSRFVKTR